MKRDLLISIHSEYATGILKGWKTIELRRKFPLFKKDDRRKIFIYACSPISKVIGECDLEEVKKMPLKMLWDISKHCTMIDLISFQKYFKNRDFGFALYLENPVKYKKPIELKKILGEISYPPQSYRYISNKLVA